MDTGTPLVERKRVVAVRDVGCPDVGCPDVARGIAARAMRPPAPVSPVVVVTEGSVPKTVVVVRFCANSMSDFASALYTARSIEVGFTGPLATG